ncbi:MAG: DUF3179 domain-containing protein [Chloroflexota bacterium]|nr:DUF3179 domain-containing protein [Chloroflexota bacterium]
MAPKPVAVAFGILIVSLLFLFSVNMRDAPPVSDLAGQATPLAGTGQATHEGPSVVEDAPTVAPEDARPVVEPSGHFDTIQVSKAGTKHLIPLAYIADGGPGKDVIPALNGPQFVGAEGWDEQNYRGTELVIGVEVNGIRRAYPFQVLVWLEIVNDTIAGVPLAVTYCPLCGTGVVFVREIDGLPVLFGVSGKLYNSDLLMFDRRTDSLWSQITGTAVVGELTGMRLEVYPSEIMTWNEWRETYPDSEVLSRDSGSPWFYDVDPYLGYYESRSIWFPVSDRDERLHAKTRVSGVEIDDVTFGAYPDEAVTEHGPVNDILGGVALLVVADPTASNNLVIFERRVGGRELTFRRDGDALVDEETGTRWSFAGEALSGELSGAQLRAIIPIKGFWFAWYAFHQDTELWQPS